MPLRTGRGIEGMGIPVINEYLYTTEFVDDKVVIPQMRGYQFFKRMRVEYDNARLTINFNKL